MSNSRIERLHARAERALDEIRHGFVQDGGNVELIGVSADGTVRVELQGACATCPAQTATLKSALEPALRRALPEMTALVPVVRRPT